MFIEREKERVSVSIKREREYIGIYKEGERVVNTSYQKLNF